MTRVSILVGCTSILLLYLTGAGIYNILHTSTLLTILLLIIALDIIYYISFNVQVKLKEMQWTRSNMQRLSKKGKWTSVKVNQIREGDYIKVSNAFVSPADILVFESTESRLSNKIIMVNESKITGKNEVSKKRPIRDFREISHINQEMFPQLAGYVEYPEPNPQIGGLLGYFKLKGDPKVTQIKAANVIYAGSQLLSSSVTGIVMYSGMNCKVVQKSLVPTPRSAWRRSHRSSIIKLIDVFSLIFLVLSIYTSLIMVLYFNGSGIHRDRVNIVDQAGDSTPVAVKYIQIIAVVFSLVPVFLVVIQECIMTLSSILVHSWEKQKAGKPGLSIEQNSSAGISADSLNSRKSTVIHQDEPDIQLELRTERPKLSKNSFVLESETHTIRRKSSSKTRIKASDLKPLTVNKGDENEGSMPLEAAEMQSPRQNSFISHRKSSDLDPPPTTERGLLTEPQLPDLESQPNAAISGTEYQPKRASSEGLTQTSGFKKKISSIKAKFDLFKENRKEKWRRMNSLFKINKHSWVKVLNYRKVLDLGNIDHVVFDKTSTITESKVKLLYFTTSKLTYQVETSEIESAIQDFFINPDAHRHDEDFNTGNNMEKEYDYYSEKSQEYGDELDVPKYKSMLFEEDSNLENLMENVKVPYILAPTNQAIGSSRLQSQCIKDTAGQIGFSDYEDSRLSITKNISQYEKEIKKGHLNLDFNTLKNMNINQIDTFLNKDRRTHMSTTSLNESSLSVNSSSYSQESEKLTEKVHSIRSFQHLLYDNYSKQSDMEQMICMAALSLHCGVAEFKSKPDPSPEKNSLVTFLEALQIKTIETNPTNAFSEQRIGYTVKVESPFQMRRTFKVLGVNPKTFGKPRTSILVAVNNNIEDQYYIYVYGDEASMKSCLLLNSHEQTHFRNLMVQYKEQMLNRIIFASKKLQREDVETYLKNYLLTLRSQKMNLDGLDRHLIPLENDLNFVGTLGFKSKIKSDAFPLINNLNHSFLSLSLLSGDSYEHCINAIKESKLIATNFSDKSSYFNLNFDNHARGEMDLITCLEVVYHDIKSKNNQKLNYYLKYLMSAKDESEIQASTILDDIHQDQSAASLFHQYDHYRRCLVIGGRTLAIIQQAPDLEEYFKILSIFAKSIVGYGLQPAQKSYLVKIIQKRQEKVLVIGDGLNDMGMMAASDVSIQIAHKDVPLYFGDFVTNNLDIIQTLIFHWGYTFFKNFKQSLLFSVAVITKFTVTNIWFFSWTTFSGRFFNSVFFGIVLVFILLDSLLRSCTRGAYSDKFMSLNPIVYQERLISEKKLAFFMTYFSLLVTFEVMFVFMVVHNFYSHITFAEGHKAHMETQVAFVTIVYYANMVSFNFFLFRDRPHFKYIPVSIYLIGIAIMMIYLHFNYYSNIPRTVHIGELVTHKYSLCCIIICIIVPSYFSYILSIVMCYKVTNPAKHFVMFILKRGKDWQDYDDNLNNSMLFKAIKRLKGSSLSTVNSLISQVSRYVKSADVTSTESIISKLLLINIHEFKTGFTQFRNKIDNIRERRKFVVLDLKEHLNFSRILLALTAFLWLVLLLVRSIKSSKYGFKFTYVLFYYEESYNIAVVMIGLAYIFIKKQYPRVLYNSILLCLTAMLLIRSVLFIVRKTTSYSSPADKIAYQDERQSWVDSNLHSRLIASTIPIGFTYSLTFIMLFGILHAVDMCYLTGPIVSSIDSSLYLTILFLQVLTLLLLMMFLKKKYDKTCKLNFLSMNKLKIEMDKSKEKLSMLMPKFVWDKINTEGLQDNFQVDDAGEVTILFCDISEFDSLVSTCSEGIVDILDEVFRQFDALSKKHAVQKIETVGKTYMACAGLKFLEQPDILKGRNSNYTERVVDLAIDMMQYINSNSISGANLLLKIGVHHGNCTFGIMGYHKPQFSLIGDTVNTTSRHCTTGDPGTIVLSTSVYKKINLVNYPNLKAKSISMKGKGVLNVFILKPEQLTSEDILNSMGFGKNSLDILPDLKHEGTMSYGDSPVNMNRMSSLGSDPSPPNRQYTFGSRNSPKKAYQLKPVPEENSQFNLDEDANNEADQQFEISPPPLFKTGQEIFATKVSSNRSLNPDASEYHFDSDSENEEFTKIDQSEKMNNIMNNVYGYAYGFKKDKRALEKFYNKQMRIKFRSKLRQCLGLISALVFMQELLLWISYNMGHEVTFMRITFFSWIFLSAIYVILSSKVYMQMVLLLLFSKTALYVLELYILMFSSNVELLDSKINLSYYSLYIMSMVDTVLLITIGIVPVKSLLLLILGSYLNLFINTLIVKSQTDELISLILSFSFFYLYNIFDAIKHFNTEVNAFFNFIKVEQKEYYLNAFVDRLMPKHIKEIADADAEKYDNVTLLFADIVGYTAFSAGKNSRQIVEVLSQLFTAFDKECNKLNLYKLYTIGDCYVVMSFLDKNHRKTPKEEASDMVSLASFMIKTIKLMREKIKFDSLNMRIGIHTGTVYGGVIGTDIVRFDLYGPDVLTANKMESGGCPGKVCVSEATKSLLDELDSTNYTFEPHKEIEIKSLNKKYQSYFLNYFDS